MKWQFKEKQGLDEIEVTIEKKVYDSEVVSLITYLESYQLTKSDMLAVKEADQIHFVKFDDIIAIEVDGDYLDIMTCKSRFKTRQRLYKIKERLATEQFVQVSKQSIININHLEMMEASFSGNMLAILTNKIKVIISRRYVKNLEKALGL
ncbi:LytTR family DNA-binding domain-containing protein [Streptococcus uberis]|uniref:LytTR family DNA-binding domain-containing protein n=1 Tax=Streptococcus uberis TaxID=1349 RepID=UPI0021F0C907|nr:LytTR family DNA-binding domain-containing protein [Streptococcus uberis]MCV6815787.1 LytTR family transcriptional regulator [Streptococcus uberis]MCZ8475801.1 LytTR family DNA-binding domain-containing protein [Streptococcus uberis]MEE3699340.1 LytTR family DNA-binding domain-containing protein [Streptococcus uberis]